jgi:hypothetical protein
MSGGQCEQSRKEGDDFMKHSGEGQRRGEGIAERICEGGSQTEWRYCL